MQQAYSAQNYEKVIDSVVVIGGPLPSATSDDKVAYYIASPEEVRHLPQAKAVIHGPRFFEYHHQQQADADLNTSDDDNVPNKGESFGHSH